MSDVGCLMSDLIKFDGFLFLLGKVIHEKDFE